VYLSDARNIEYPPDLELFLSKSEILYKAGKSLCPRIFRRDHVKARYKEELSKTDLRDIVFCSEHAEEGINFITEEVASRSFEGESALFNQQLRAKDVLSAMVNQRGREVEKTYEDLVAEACSEEF